MDLATKFAPYTDELFSQESKLSLLTNQDFDWINAETVKIYKVGTATMNDYDRRGAKDYYNRYGHSAVDATTEAFTLSKDRSFSFAIDKRDEDETVMQLSAATALSRQEREVIIPEVDTYVYNVMCTKAGTKPAAKTLTAENIYDEILTASQDLDDALVPDTQRVLVVSPAVYRLIKQCKEITMETEIGNDMRLKGVVSNLDGANVIRVPSVRLPENFGFLLAHPSATVAPTKLKDFVTHTNPPGISGTLVEGRIVYDAFVLDNKTKALYYQAQPASE